MRPVEFRQETAIWSLAGALAILAAVALASIDAGLIALAWRLTAPADFGPAPAFPVLVVGLLAARAVLVQYEQRPLDLLSLTLEKGAWLLLIWAGGSLV